MAIFANCNRIKILQLVAYFGCLLFIHKRQHGFITRELELETESIRPSPPQHPAIRISVNETSVMAQDLVSIIHNPTESRVSITLKQDARCPRPYLIGRLSGPALVLLRWKWFRNPDNTTSMQGFYNVPTPGHYFLEVVVVYCDDFLYSLKHSSGSLNLSNSMIQNAMAYDFQKVCVEGTWKHRLTASNATISIPARTDQNENNAVAGFWQQESNQSALAGNTSSTSNQPVFTRHQRNRCHRPGRQLSEECRVATEIERYKPYTFQWSSALQPLYNPQAALKQDVPTTICFLGDSHSRELNATTERLGITQERFNISTEWILGGTYFPHIVDPENLVPKVENCSKLVIGIGQWPASYAENYPYLMNQYHQEMRDMLKRLSGNQNISSLNMDIVLRSLHYNPLGFRTTHCNPSDWRTPLVFDGYNRILESLSLEFGIPFLNTNDVIGPVWDSASDWCHLNDYVQNPEYLYILASLLGLNDKREVGTTALAKD